MEINSKKYWEERFKTEDWEDASGDKQTVYFAQLAAQLIPEWFKKKVAEKQYDICDLGCAEGDAAPSLKQIFPKSHIKGIDISESAIKRAREKFAFGEFAVGDLFMETPLKYDVVFCSNVIEHFYCFQDTLKQICSFSNHYTIIMCPLRENFEVPEHEVVITTKDIPCSIAGNKLIYAKSTWGDIKYYGGEQILLIYSQAEEDENALSLGDLADEVRSVAYNESEKAWKRINDALYLANEENKNLKNEIAEKEETIKSEIVKRIEILEKNSDNIKLLPELNRIILESKDEKLFEYKQIQDEIEVLKKQKESLIEDIAKLDQNHLAQCKEMIEMVMKSKSYLILLGIRRTFEQLIMGPMSEKKDFFKFTANKIFKTKYSCKGTQNFDLLWSASRFLTGLQAEFREGEKNGNAKRYMVSSCIKNTYQIFIFTGVPFYDVGGGQRCSQLTKVFDKMGYEVHYIYAFESSESKKFDIFNPALNHIYLNNLDENKLLDIIKSNAMFIFEAPYSGFLPYVNLGKRCGIPVIYEHIDNWETSLGSLLYDKDSFNVFIEKSDYLVATSVELVKQLKKYTDKDISYLPNAVDINIFEPSYKSEEPKDLIKGKNKTLLYFGSLWGEWFDWDLLVEVAKRTPDSTYNMIGDSAPIQDKLSKLPSNIHFLGLKRQTELPSYLQYSDIAILPFKNCEIGKYVSPLKIFEYIAMGKYVLSEPLPDVIGYPNTLCSYNADDWVKAINSEIEIKEYAEFVSKNSWYDRCEKLLALTDSYYLNAQKYSGRISVIILNHNNDKVIQKCIASLLRHNNRYQYEIIIVDNKSTDNSVENLSKNFGDKVKLIMNDKNGCSSGRNLGVKNANGEYIVFLDSDQWVVSDLWLDAALWILENRKTVGAVSWGAGWFTTEDCRGPIVDYFENRAMSSELLYRTDLSYLATSGFVMKKELFNTIGGFDEYYDPTCFEDTDLSLAVNHSGLQTAYCPYLNIMHLPHQTTESGSKKHTELFNRNSKYFIEKWKNKDPKVFEKTFNVNIQA